ncbi:ImmA/IrrE family metallo-endopeptidase [Kribbella sp. NPDC020789]
MSNAREVWIALRHQAQLKGFRVSVRPMEASEVAYCSYEPKEIAISDRLDPVEAVSRLAHEVAHLQLHADLGGPDDLQHHGVREIEAELVAYDVLLSNGITPDDSMIRYMAAWAVTVTPTKPLELIKALGESLVVERRRLSNSVQNYVRAHLRPSAAVDDLGHEGPGL